MKYSVLLGTFIAGAVLGGICVSIFLHPSPAPIAGNLAPLRSGASQPVNVDTARYSNSAYGLSLQYPAELALQEFDNGSGAMTAVFQKEGEEKGFQIFIVPYTETTITRERIKADLAGAPMEKAVQIVLPGGIQAVHFESHAPIIGDSSEVWFIHNGYLYEVTTYRALDTWLAGILGTLQFTK